MTGLCPFYARPVVPILLAWMTGVCAGALLPGRVAPAWGLIALGFFWTLRRAFRKRGATIGPLLLFTGLGCLSIQPWLAPRFPDNHVIRFADGATHWRIAGAAERVRTPPGKRPRFILQTETLGRGNAPAFPAVGRLRITIYDGEAKISSGDRVAFRSKIKPIRNFQNPGGFDYERYMAFQKIWAAGYVRQDRIAVLESAPDQGPRTRIADWRTEISALIDAAGAGPAYQVLKALTVGDRSGVSPELREAFNRAGVSHLLAISGLHVGIIAWLAFSLCRMLLSRSRTLLFQARTTKAAAVLSVFPVLAYGLVSGMSPSTQRAVIMAAAFLMTFPFRTLHDIYNTLALAALLILIIHPPALLSVSFQLSFSAVIAIIYGLGVLLPPESPLTGLRKKLTAFAGASLMAILGTLPLVLYYFNQVSLVGLAANMVMIPLIGFIAVPLGLGAVFLSPVSVPAAQWCVGWSASVLTLAADIIWFFADLPMAAVKTVTPSPLEIALYYSLGWALLTLYHLQKRSAGVFSPCGRRAGAVGLCALILLAADALYWTHQRFGRRDLRITCFDVGQGSAALLELPGGACVLIDGGGFYDNAVFDVGARIIAPLLWKKKIAAVDALVLTHPNADHLNGLLFIAEHFRVKTVWTNGEPADIDSYRAFRNIIARNRIHAPDYEKIFGVRALSGVRFEVLYPPPDFREKADAEPWRDLNNNSLCVKVRFGRASMLFTGDIMAEAEAELVRMAGGRLKSDILMSPHHGSASSSAPAFLDAVQPDAVVISAGWRNRFHFPAEQTLNAYRERHIRVFRTDRDGAVRIRADGDRLFVRPFLGRAECPIPLSDH